MTEYIFILFFFLVLVENIEKWLLRLMFLFFFPCQFLLSLWKQCEKKGHQPRRSRSMLPFFLIKTNWFFMFYIQVIKCQGTEGNNGSQWLYPASPGISPHPCPMVQDPISAHPRATSPRPSDVDCSPVPPQPGAGPVEPGPSQRLTSPSLKRSLTASGAASGCPPGLPRSLAGGCGKDPGWSGPWGSPVPPGTQLQAAACPCGTLT